MTRFLRMTLMGLAGASVLAGCATDEGPPLGSGPVYATARGETLTAPSRAPAAETIAAFLAQLPGRRAVDTLQVTSAVTSTTGLTHVKMQQVVGGLRVVGAYVKATVDADGALVHLIDQMAAVPAGGLAAGPRDDAGALRAALAYLGLAAETAFHTAPTVERVAYLDGARTLRAGYLVETWTAAGNQLHHTVVDDAGRIVSDELRSNRDQYNVFVEDPGKGGQVVADGPGAGNAESPAGWLAGAQLTINIRGNNARAYLDRDTNNAPDPGGASIADGRFLTAADLLSDPTTAGNQAVAVQNLFYLTNVTHDILYRHGFDEAAGNFQVDNFAQGGAGNDPVQAEAQDGGGTDNANFATPADGSPPRMQMYLWSSALPGDEVVVDAPASIAGSYGARAAQFGPALTTTGFTGDVVAVDGDGCQSVTGASGRIALIPRGNCNFTDKVLNAQSAGAIGVIISNNVGTNESFAMAGTSRRVRIPSVMIGQADGATLRSVTGVHATARKLAVQPPMIDGDLDSDIVYHEYGHGLTWRMIGGMSGPLAGAIGEGASDTVSMLINGDDIVGEYAFSSPAGIRRHAYANYPLTYADVTGEEVHNDGEVFAAIMWRLMEIFDREALSRDLLFDYFVDGMNYTPATPAWEDMRDGMLQSVALHGLGHECLIWEAFAQYGVGVGAVGESIRGGHAVRITESFAKPSECEVLAKRQ